MLSTRATRFLSTLERRPHISTQEVETIIREQNKPCFPVWLDFHERYAGYVLKAENDWAIWGLVHEKPVWLLARRADIEHDSLESKWYIACADTNPTHDYRLDNAGEFLANPAESFDINVERIALATEFRQRGVCRIIALRDTSSSTKELFEKEIKRHFVPEASDRFARHYMSERYLAEEDPETGELLSVTQIVSA